MTDGRRFPDEPRADRELWDLVAAIPVAPAGDDFMPRLATSLAGTSEIWPDRGRGTIVLPGHAVTRERRRFPIRLFIVAATVAAAGAILAFAVLPALRGTDTATAADMLASMDSASEGARIVRLRIVEGLVPVASPSPSPGPCSIRTPGSVSSPHGS